MTFWEKIKPSSLKEDPFKEAELKYISIARELARDNPNLYPEKDAQSTYERLKNLFRGYKRFSLKLARIGVVAGVLMSGMPSMSAEKYQGDKKEIPTAAETLKLQSQIKKRREGTPWYKEWRLNQVVIEKNEKGEWVFNPLKLILPIQIEKAIDNKDINSFKFQVPQEYARLFDSGKPLRSEDYEKVKNYISNQLQKQLENKLKGLNLSIETQREIKEGQRHPILENIAVSGYASPEGPAQKGPETIKPGNVDQKNIELASLRAKNALNIAIESLEKLGMSKEDIDKSLATVKAEELQFSPDEMKELILMSKGWKGTTPLEKIFNMIIDYNDNKIQDPKLAEKLHKIIASKRIVEIEGKLSGEEKTIYAVPIPLLLGLLPFIRMRRRGTTPEPTPPTTPEPEPTPTPTLEPGPTPEPTPQPTPEPTPEPITVEPIPDNPEEDKDFPKKIKVALVDDLYQFFDNEDTIRRGLNYRALCDEMIKNFNRFASDKDRENYLAKELLRLWREHDIKARREAGWQEENITEGLDYENQPNQRLWALAHSKVILRLVKEKMENPNLDYFDLMSKDIENYMDEKSEGGKEGVKEIKESSEKNTKKEQKEDWLKTSVQLAMEGRITWEKDEEE